jgi:hypothetical protein
MGRKQPFRLQTIFPFLRYSDAPAAIDWLVRPRVREADGPGEDGVIARSAIDRPEASGPPGQAGGERPDDPQAACTASMCSLRTSRSITGKRAGAEIVGEL